MGAHGSEGHGIPDPPKDALKVKCCLWLSTFFPPPLPDALALHSTTPLRPTLFLPSRMNLP